MPLDPEKDDPLARATAPPDHETPGDREARLAAEAEALRVSNAIDEEINRQRALEKKSPKSVRILLLGRYIHLWPTRMHDEILNRPCYPVRSK